MDDNDSAYILGEPALRDAEQQVTDSPIQQESGRKPVNLAAWEGIANFWDKTLGEGNDMFLQLLLPAVEELARVRSGYKVLDLGTGNGIVASRLSREGVEVLATDFSAAQIENAKRRAEKAKKSIRFELLDLTDPVALNDFAKQHAEEFDVITASMLLKELSDIKPLAEFLLKVLKPKGRIVMANLHPCFHKPGAHRVVEVVENPETGSQEFKTAIKVSKYLNIGRVQSQALRGQPEPLCHIAGGGYSEKGSRAAQGYELQLGANVLGTFAITKFLTPFLVSTAKTSPPGTVRVVSVFSSAAEAQSAKVFVKGLADWEKNDQYPQYCLAKLENYYHATEFTARHTAGGIISVPLNLGNIDSDFWRTRGPLILVTCILQKKLLHPPRYGAYTNVFAKFSPEVTRGKSGTFGMHGFFNPHIIIPLSPPENVQASHGGMKIPSLLGANSATCQKRCLRDPSRDHKVATARPRTFWTGRRPR